MEAETNCENCIIKKFNSLRALGKAELKKIADAKTTMEIKKGERLFGEGDTLEGVFCVRDGISKLSKLSANGRDQIVKLTRQGEVIGQRSVLAGEATNLSAVAVSDMTVCFVPKENLLHVLNMNPKFAIEVLRQMAQDLKEADNIIVNIAQKSAKQRVAEALLYLHDKFGADPEGYLVLNLSREDLANVVGTATESTIRALSHLKRKGLIVLNGKKIAICDEPGLKNLINGINVS